MGGLALTSAGASPESVRDAPAPTVHGGAGRAPVRATQVAGSIEMLLRRGINADMGSGGGAWGVGAALCIAGGAQLVSGQVSGGGGLLVCRRRVYGAGEGGAWGARSAGCRGAHSLRDVDSWGERDVVLCRAAGRPSTGEGLRAARARALHLCCVRAVETPGLWIIGLCAAVGEHHICVRRGVMCVSTPFAHRWSPPSAHTGTPLHANHPPCVCTRLEVVFGGVGGRRLTVRFSTQRCRPSLRLTCKRSLCMRSMVRSTIAHRTSQSC